MWLTIILICNDPGCYEISFNYVLIQKHSSFWVDLDVRVWKLVGYEKVYGTEERLNKRC